jgi:hypothetical protein
MTSWAKPLMKNKRQFEKGSLPIFILDTDLMNCPAADILKTKCWQHTVPVKGFRK